MLNIFNDIIHVVRTFFEGRGWPLLVTVALILSVLFWTCCLIGIAIFYYRDYRYRICYSRIYPILRDFIYEQVLVKNNVSHFPIDKLGLNLEKRLEVKVVRDILHEFIRTIGGEKGRSMRNLFNELGYDKEAQYEIRHAAKHMAPIVRSLNDLALMKVVVQENVLDKLLASPKIEIRVAAFQYLLQVQGEQAFDRVFSQLEGINELHAVDIYQTIVLTDYFGTYSFSQWLDESKTFAANKLLMDLMVYYQELEASQLWKLIVANKDMNTIIKAVNSLGKLLARESEDQLRDLYDQHQSLHLRIEILKAIGRLGQGKSLDFLANIFENSELPVKLRKHAYRSLITQRPYSTMYLRRINDNTDAMTDRLIRYITNPMVHYI
ncbi:MAG: hypothetical protein K0R59_886 [Sphingobacterium sp.]|jgi:hypothetical protein|uniref:HEAT repeat domain-containing protein n=1 Tax=Sphingobacterium sp. CZ-UAM TaxID=1933868 RepID=UPI000987A15F|nr:HEAT repeat domain-containing protein [Sphingobacterium sp. CZ-UAM]MDF2515590.1 hypothetical protein [Sphingobacterium sp.]OOG19506.1 hypothetical protein BWD42_06160 [Sphingobacterium sp. CZ-UAM]